MTYSIESRLFKAAVGVVNTAARAANGLLEVMYPPRYDVAHIWDEPEEPPTDALRALRTAYSYWCSTHEDVTGRCPADCLERLRREQEALDKLAAPCADPHPAGAADPAGGTPPPPAGSLTWEAWSIPAICEALGDHVPGVLSDGRIRCADEDGSVHEVCEDWIDWREHAAPDIARRIGCDPARAALALTSLQTQ